MKINIQNVISGTYPDYEIDFAQLKVSKGTLTGTETGDATAIAGHKVDFSWADNTGVGDALATDKVMALIINYDRKAVVQDITTKSRADLALSLTVPADWAGDTVYVYIAFSTVAKDKFTDSSFLGELVVLT